MLDYLQVAAIRTAYEDLEQTYRTSRESGKRSLGEYKQEAGETLTKLHEMSKKLNSDLSDTHVVEYIQKSSITTPLSKTKSFISRFIRPGRMIRQMAVVLACHTTKLSSHGLKKGLI